MVGPLSEKLFFNSSIFSTVQINTRGDVMPYSNGISMDIPIRPSQIVAINQCLNRNLVNNSCHLF